MGWFGFKSLIDNSLIILVGEGVKLLNSGLNLVGADITRLIKQPVISSRKIEKKECEARKGKGKSMLTISQIFGISIVKIIFRV